MVASIARTLGAVCLAVAATACGAARTVSHAPPTGVERAPERTAPERVAGAASRRTGGTASSPPVQLAGQEVTAQFGPAEAFAGQSTVTVAELIAALAAAQGALREAPAVASDYAALLAAHDVAPEALPYDEYVAVRIAFETTRDGGLWGLVWDITNRPGHSDAIWSAWQTAPVPSPASWGVTAIAECDELSALFAFLARRLGVAHAGFLGGGPMHVVAHWTVRQPRGPELRIVVPTSQVFLTREATLGTQEIRAYSAPTVWDYWRADVAPERTIPAPLARWFVAQLPLVALPAAELQRRRNTRGRS